MKKAIAIIIAAALAFSAFIITANAAADPPKLVYEPVTVTARIGTDVEMRTVAEGSDLVFKWSMLTCEDGNDHIFDLTDKSGVAAFEKNDGSGKMKISFKTNKLDNNRTEGLLIIENIIGFNYGATVMCTVSNGSGSAECDKAIIYTSPIAPVIPNVQMIADFSVRLNKLVKLACFPYVPDGAGYTDDDITYDWYQTPDGSKENGVYLDEHDPVLMADSYASSVGDYYFYCQINISIGGNDFAMESGVTVMHVYYPDIKVSFDKDNVILDKGEEAVINLNVSVEPEADRGELSYQWFLGTDPDSIFGTIPGARSDSYKVKGYNYADVEYYTVVVTNITSDDFSYDNLFAEKAFVKVIHTGAEPLKITKMPESVTADEDENVSFRVSADGAVSYAWYAERPDGTSVALKAGEYGVISGEKTDTLTVKAGKENSEFNFYCVLSSGSGKTLQTDKAKLTVIYKVIPLQTPTVTVTPSEITAGPGDKVVLFANAEVTDGGVLKYQWFEFEGDMMKPIEGAVNASFEPENTPGTKKYCVTVINTIYELQSLPVISDTATVEFKESSSSDPESGKTPATTADEPGNNSGNTGKTLVVILVSAVVVFTAALIAAGVIVLVKYGKKKNK